MYLTLHRVTLCIYFLLEYDAISNTLMIKNRWSSRFIDNTGCTLQAIVTAKSIVIYILCNVHNKSMIFILSISYYITHY